MTEFVRHVANLWDQHLRERLAGVYLIGSLAHGGYQAHFSDIDMVVISHGGLTAADLELVRGGTELYFPVLAPKVSLFWGDTTFSVGRFPPLDRIDYLDHRVVLLERQRLLPDRPALREVRTYLGTYLLGKWPAEVMRLIALSELLEQDRKPYLRALLYPARFLYSWETGNVVSNDDAVAFAEAHNFAGSETDLLTRALRCRNAETPEECLSLLFSERRRLHDLLRVCRGCVRTEQE